MAIGKSFDLKKRKMTKESIRIFGLTQKLGKNFIYRHHFEPSSTYVPRRIIPYFTRFTFLNETPPTRKRRCGWRKREKPKHLRQKQIQLFDIAGDGRNSVLNDNFTQEFTPMKRS